MNSRPEFNKLIELRSKTDRQLIVLITNRLDAGLTYARLVVNLGSSHNRASGEAFQTDALEAYDEVRALLPWVSLTQAERRRLELKMDQLRDLLNESTIHAGMRVQTACS
jgi:hypothetical protein